MALIFVLLFTLGSAVGSFLNVVIDRTTRRESIMGRSYCDHCKATLGTLDLIPIVSFVGLGRRCRYCRKPLSWQYPLVEALTGFLFVSSFWVLSLQGSLSLTTLAFWLIIISTLIVVGVVDIKFSLIPTSLVFAGSLLALFYAFFFLSSSLFIDHVIAAFLGAFFFLVIVFATRGKGMGEGDIFLAFLLGMVLGIKATILAVFLAFVLGSVIALLLIAVGKKRFGQTVPFAPFLVLGFLISLYFASPILSWYLMLY